MDSDAKLALLRAATAFPFTDRAALLAHLATEFPALAANEVEAFFDGVADFAAISAAFADAATGAVDSAVPTPDSESKSPSHSRPQSPTAESTRSPSPSPSLVVPIKTPSGRTLRSASTVNTSEPRRLRSTSSNTINKQ